MTTSGTCRDVSRREIHHDYQSAAGSTISAPRIDLRESPLSKSEPRFRHAKHHGEIHAHLGRELAKQ